MIGRRILYIVLVIGAFMIGTQINIDLKTSQVFTSDVIAVVNNDQKVDYIDESLKLGDNFVNQLDTVDSKYQFQTTSSAEASQGLISGKYGAEILIPSNFTTSILSVNSERPNPTSITYSLNDKLLSSKSKSMEDEIITNISRFEDNITYMYLYSIFDGLHATQEGVETAYANSQPVFKFLEQLGEIDIVGNHEYELTDNNSDSFSIIDISEQLSQFSKTVDDYQAAIAEVIEVYRDDNTGYSTLVDESLAIMTGNDQLLNDRIENVEDTLNTIVDSNQQYTEDSYSITNSSSNIEAIITKYLDQLQVVNNTYDQNKKTLENTHKINDSLKELETNTQVQAIKNLFNTRVSYYTSLNTIVETCLSAEESAAASCISSQIGAYSQGYSDYNDIISQFKHEQDYYQIMNYYLEQIAATSVEPATDEAVGELQTFSVPIESEIPEGEKPSSATEEDQVPELSLYSFGETLTATDTSQNNVVGLHISNLGTTSSLTIDINGSRNIGAVTSLPTRLDNARVTVEDDRIRVNQINANELNLLFDVEKNIDNLNANLELEYKDQVVSVSIGEKSQLTVVPTVDQDQVTLDYQYTVQAADEVVQYTDSKLISDYGIDQFTLTEDGTGAVTTTSTGFEINTAGKVPGDQIEFTVSFDNLIGNQAIVESYTLAGQTYSFPIVSDLATVVVDIDSSDDPYIISPDNVSNEDDDIDQNNLFEPQEEVALNYEININSTESYTVSKLKFTTNLETIISPDSSPEIAVQVGGTTVNPDVTVSDQSITIDFGAEISSTEIPDPGSDEDYQLPINIYINFQMLEAITLETLEDEFRVTLEDLELTTNSITSPSDVSESQKVELAAGEVNLTSIEYAVDSSSCLGASELSECSFEAGEQIQKTITITSGDEAVAGLVINDLFEGNEDELVTLENPIQYDLVLDPLATFDSNQYIEEQINDDDPAHIKFSMPANSTLTITKLFTIDENITKLSTILNSNELTEYGITLATSQTNLQIIPLALKVNILDDEQVTEDGVITPNEAVNIKLEIKNDSQRGTSETQYLQMVESDSRPIDSVRVMAVEDKNWNSIEDRVTTTSRGMVINQPLAPQEAFTIELRINFNNLSSVPDPSQVDISFVSYKPTYDPSVDVCSEADCTIRYRLSTNPDYLQLARDQAETAVIGSDDYKRSLRKSNQVVKQSNTIINNVKEMRDYINTYISLDIKLNKFTILDNTEIEELQQKIADFGLDYEYENDEDLPDYDDYCPDNSELSCQIFALFDQIKSSEAEAKTSFESILQTINPSDETQYGEKPNEDQETINPTNIGADFNGYGECKLSININGGSIISETCDPVNPGINERIDMQSENIELVESNIDKILDNETEEVNEDPYKEQLTQINEQTNQVMDQVESENNELFSKKIDVYNENYQAVMEYVTEISEDPAYADAIEDFNGEELLRQEESKIIYEHVYNLLPNTYLDGIPNKLVYSFIASPFTITEQQNNQPITTITESEHPWVVIFMLGLLAITTALIGILYYINREV